MSRSGQAKSSRSATSRATRLNSVIMLNNAFQFASGPASLKVCSSSDQHVEVEHPFGRQQLITQHVGPNRDYRWTTARNSGSRGRQSPPEGVVWDRNERNGPGITAGRGRLGPQRAKRPRNHHRTGSSATATSEKAPGLPSYGSSPNNEDGRRNADPRRRRPRHQPVCPPARTSGPGGGGWTAPPKPVTMSNRILARARSPARSGK